MTMIDLATGWFEIKEVATKRADVIANVLETTWLTRYPLPTEVVADRGTEFMGVCLLMVREEYGLPRKLITARNPQANAIIERCHQNTMASFAHLDDTGLEDNDDVDYNEHYEEEEQV